jgi:hypothetical protein
MVVAGLLLYAGYLPSLLKRPLGWQFAWIALAIIPIAAIIQYAMRLFAPQQIQRLIDRLTYRQRFGLYWLHYLAIISFLVAGIALLCLDFTLGIDRHRGRDLLQWLWIDCLVLVMCLADLSAKTGNIWAPQKPARRLREENI